MQNGSSLLRCAMIAQDEAAVADGAAVAVKGRGRLMDSNITSTPEVIVLQPAVAA